MKRLLPILLCVLALVSCGSDDEDLGELIKQKSAVTKDFLECGTDWNRGTHESGRYDVWMNFDNGVFKIMTFYGNYPDFSKTGTFQYELNDNILTLKQDGEVKYQSPISKHVSGNDEYIVFQSEDSDNLLCYSLKKTKYTVVKDGYMKGYMEKH